MMDVRYTLVSDGSSDRALLPILTWLLQQQLPRHAVQPTWAELRRLPQPPRTPAARIAQSVELYPCDVLFVHRDAEGEARLTRVEEIMSAVSQAGPTLSIPPVVCVVPVRMQEAWLLFDEQALREAAGNPNGRQPLQLPRVRDLEGIRDPKQSLDELLREASGLSGRRRKKFQTAAHAHRVAELIADFSPLRGLEAFAALEADIRRVIQDQGWQ